MENDIQAKINELLGDPESLQQIAELAEMFKGELGFGDTPPLAAEKNANNFSSPQGGGITDILKIIGGNNAESKNAKLLLALKPYLSEEKQIKVDKAIKILRLIEMFLILKESGFLNDVL
jgi:hypothetical protein